MKDKIEKPGDQMLVIFGASGDLTKRKLIPALYSIYLQNLLPDKFCVLGVSRTEMSDDEFRSQMADAIEEFSKNHKADNDISGFLNRLYYQSINTSDENEYKKLEERIIKLNKENNTRGNIVFYLSTPPSLYHVIPKNLSRYSLNKSSEGFRRIVIEKPFGYDIKSAKKLNKDLLEYFNEDDIYRIDHYLGKETVQNVLVTRFSNGIFEPLWNSKYVNRVEVTSAESIGVESRGGYFDGSGTLRDMVQNHLMQMVGLVAMEPPSSFESNSIRNETLKVFQSLREFSERDIKKNVIRGQYTSSSIGGEKVKAYREENGVDKKSRTETFVAIKFYIDNWRWGGVPFYIRSGKRLPTRVTEIVIHFNKTPHWLFGAYQKPNEACNQLILRIQPDEGILLKFAMKVPGQGFNVQNVKMDFHYADLRNTYVPEAYERLLLDALLGDSTLYTRGDAVEQLWQFIAPVQKTWNEDQSIPLYGYPAGTWGPETANDLIEEEGITWQCPCSNLTDETSYCEL